MLELELGLEPEGSDRRIIRLPAPTRDVDALVALIRLDLDAHPPGAAVAAFGCFVHPNRPRRGQLTLFGAPEIHPEKLAATMARIAGRIGPDRVGSPRVVDGHLPERFDTTTFDPPPAPKLRREPKNGRGLLAVRVLRPPVPLEVITEEVNDNENYELGIMNDELPSQVHPKNSNASGDGSEIHNSKFIIHNLRLISVTSETGATPRVQGLVRIAAGPWSLLVERESRQARLLGCRALRRPPLSHLPRPHQRRVVCRWNV